MSRFPAAVRATTHAADAQGATMAYTLAQAAVAVRRSKSSVLRAIKAGKVSAVRDEASAEWRIELAALHRLYPVADAQAGSQGDAQSLNEGAQVEMRELRARLADKDDVIADLPQQRDQQRVAAVLTDLRAGPHRSSWPWRWG